MIEGREQAHAPRYTYLVRRHVSRAVGLVGPVDLSGMGRFFFDYGHDIRCRSRTTLTNLTVGRDWGSWSAKLWVRNVFDNEYFVRGFYFGNEPPDFPNKLYTRLGDPRQYRLHAQLSFWRATCVSRSK